MNRIFKKRIAIVIFIIFITDIFIGCFLFKSRSFQHLAVWKIIESGRKEDFYWDPAKAPGYFRFEPESNKLFIFKDEIKPVIGNEKDDFRIMLAVARHVINFNSKIVNSNQSVKWDSPEIMLRQVKMGARPNCYHNSILFSTYVASLGIKSRLWALENDKFNGISHTITEVYINGLNKWVFMDVHLGFYVVDNYPLSFLEFRDRLLNQRAIGRLTIYNIDTEKEEFKESPDFYKQLVKCAFLRVDNDFLNKYDNKIRYGIFSMFNSYIDKLPESIRRGLDYFLGRRDIFIHYVNSFSGSLKLEIVRDKFFFNFFIYSLACIVLFLLIVISVCLKNLLVRNLSLKDTRHR